MKDDLKFSRACRFFNRAEYFEAHEQWEDLWRSASGNDRDILQGLVQAAVGLHHLARGNEIGGRAVLGRSIRRLAGHRVRLHELCGAAFLGELERILSTGAPGSDPPRIAPAD